MDNAFLVMRTVFFALLAYFHALLLVFASWNIMAAKSFGMSAPGASTFLILNSAVIFVLLSAAYLAELICAKARPAHVRVECAWTVLMSVLELAASVDVTLNGPPVYCQMHSLWAMCASSSLLVHVSWLVTFIMLSYCLIICNASVAHATSLPDIWIMPVPHVPWFGLGASAPAPATISHLPAHRHSKIPSSSFSVNRTSLAVSKNIAERWERLSMPSGPILFTKGRQSVDPTRPTWAREHRIRRGVDHPFSKPSPNCGEPPVILAPPPRTHPRRGVTPRSPHSVTVDVNEQPQPETRCATQVSHTSSVFARTLVNPDLIPSDRSEWVRASTLSWISYRAEPHPSP